MSSFIFSFQFLTKDEEKDTAGTKKNDLHDLGSDDLLSRLSDDILGFVLSYLPIKYAAVTSMLSRRWRYLWCQTVRLDFEDKERSNKLRSLCNDLIFAERNRYINWVNRFIRQHKSPNIDEFKIGFDLDETSKGAIGKWVEIAILKNVQRLELDLGVCLGSYKWENYAFPKKIFDRKCKSSSKRPSFDVPVTLYATVKEIKFLKALILKRVDVDDECLKKILSNCPVLEHLSIDDSNKLEKAKIHGIGIALKNLEIILCSDLECIEIHDSTIVSFNCERFNSNDSPLLRLNNLQKLEKVSFYDFNMNINHMFSQLSCGTPNLQVLKLGFYISQERKQFFTFPTLPKLKHLIVKVGNFYASFPVLASMVEACPHLQRFTVQEPTHESYTYGLIDCEADKQPHQHLEVVEIDNYYGQTSDLDLVMYFIEKSVALKKLVIKPYIEEAGLAANEITEVKNGARYRARQQFEPKIPVGVELVLL